LLPYGIAIRGFLARHRFTAEKQIQEKKIILIIKLQAGMTVSLHSYITYYTDNLQQYEGT